MEEVKYNIDFWKAFDKTKVTKEHSMFAEFCLPYMKKGEKLLDVCCGNFRDTYFFADKGMIMDAFDHEDFNLEDKKLNFDLIEKFDHVYCRFILHVIPEHLEDYVLINAHNVLKEGGLFYIEARSNKGEVPVNNHYRRLIDIDELRNKLIRLNFEIVFETETNGLSVYNNEDPILIRFIVRKSGEIRTRGTLREEKATYRNPINSVSSMYLLLTTKQIFDDNNIPFFLVYGTLLGAYREKGFIKHDTDIDIGLLDKYWEQVMALINGGYFAIHGLLYIREEHKKRHLKALQYKNDWIDFWFFKKAKEMYKSGRFYNMQAFQIDDGFSDIDFYGQKFKTVNNIEAYLNRHYRGNWKLPVKDYHAKF